MDQKPPRENLKSILRRVGTNSSLKASPEAIGEMDK